MCKNIAKLSIKVMKLVASCRKEVESRRFAIKYDTKLIPSLLIMAL